jgi:hypothetical protein
MDLPVTMLDQGKQVQALRGRGAHFGSADPACRVGRPPQIAWNA